MKIVVQRVESACVLKENQIFSEIGNGLVIYTGIEKNEQEDAIDWLLEKLEENLKPTENVLILSQFTLLASFKGSKPSFHRAEEHLKAKVYFEKILEKAKENFPGRVKNGVFGVRLEILQKFEDLNVDLWEY